MQRRPTHVPITGAHDGAIRAGLEVDAVARTVRRLTRIEAEGSPERLDALLQWTFRRHAVAMARSYGAVVDDLSAARAAAGDMDGITGRGERVVHGAVAAMRELHASTLDDEPVPPDAVVEAVGRTRALDGKTMSDASRVALQSVAERVADILNALSDAPGPTAGVAATDALGAIPGLAETGMGDVIVDVVAPVMLGAAFGTVLPLPSVGPPPSRPDAPDPIARADVAATALERVDDGFAVATESVVRALDGFYRCAELAEVVVGRPVFTWKTVVDAGIVGRDTARLFVNAALEAGIVRNLRPDHRSGRVFVFPATVSTGMDDDAPSPVLALTGRGLDGDPLP